MVRHRRNLGLLARFGIVGASGVVVNMVTLIVLRKLGPHFDDAVVGLATTEFNLRWYHVYSTVAFLVANLWNFQLNRTWTFQSSRHAQWWRSTGPSSSSGWAARRSGWPC
jgi:putative flippase GtrA